MNLGTPAKLGYSLWEMENDTEDDEQRKILELPLRWAAARGPWPEQNETNMCEDRLKPCLQCVYNSLVDLMRLTIVNSNIVRKSQLCVAINPNVSCISYAWHGVGDWRA